MIGKKKTALENLQRLLEAEQINFAKIRARQEKYVTTALIDREVELFINDAVLKIFEQLKHELGPHYKKIRIVAGKRSVSLRVSEPLNAVYFCRLSIIRKTRAVDFESSYRYCEYTEGERTDYKIGFESQSFNVRSLDEIDAEMILQFFNKSFFRRLDVCAQEQAERARQASRAFIFKRRENSILTEGSIPTED